MPDYSRDQAAGLRRLFGHRQPRVVAFASGSAGVGKSLLVANLAALLARQGQEVLVLDENARNSAASYYGALVRHDLIRVIDGEKRLDEVMATAMPGVRILPAAQAVQKLALLTKVQQETLLVSFSEMQPMPDVILVDASLDHPLGFSPLGLAAHDTLIVVAASGSAITEAYALIKKVSLGYARKHFRVLITRARSRDEAWAIYGNIAKVAGSRGVAHLEYAGYVPTDDRLQQSALLGQPIAGLFPEAPASRAYGHIAGELLKRPMPGDAGGGIEHFLQQLLHLSQQIDPVAIYA